MKIHGGNCRPDGGPIPCEGQHMYYCSLCGAGFWTSSETRSEDTLSGRVYPSPSYPACSPLHLKTLQDAGRFTRPRKLTAAGAPLMMQPTLQDAPLPDISDAKKGG